ncbi:MAG: hypothetical protein LBV72_09830 [Tannerella sp.]|jgi:hypothetical protein|nr:hypothetical protein [Tannerella sp.]
MTKFVYLFYLSLYVLSACSNATSKNSDYESKIETLVLSENNQGVEYIFSVDDENNVLEYSITYLGKFKTSKNKVLYAEILNGNKISPRLNTYLVIYDEQNNRLGKYGSVTPKPEVDGDNLLFKEKYGDCNQPTTIDFKMNIPEQIFINCQEENGQMFGSSYSFSKE